MNFYEEIKPSITVTQDTCDTIKKKLEHFKTVILPALLENENTRTWLIGTVREFTNTVRENPNVQQENMSNNTINYQNKLFLEQNNQKSNSIRK